MNYVVTIWLVRKKILRTGSKNLHKGKYDIFLLIYETETASNAKVWTGFFREYM